MNHKAIAIIPARGGSKRIPRKNLVDLGGKPLIAHSIISAKKSKYLNGRIFVSTEDSEIARVAKKYGTQVRARPHELATDKATTLSVLKHAIGTLESQGLDFDTVVLLQATCPFRKTSTIDKSIKKLWGNWQKLDGVFSVKKTKFPPAWMLRTKGKLLEFLYPNDFSQIRGQDLEKTYEIDGVLYVLKKDLVIKSKDYPFAHGKTSYIISGKIESIDIDDEEDLEIAKSIENRLRSEPLS